ncbi:MAG: hypothetical protein HY392_02850, partial [Candidatus Diapherotrites archaeon]|nr:hypothetical protein [Candidatus Diapherotrites archaeon]
LKIENLRYLIPYTPDGLEALFDLYSGNIRHILNSLNTAVLEATKEQPVILDKNDIAIILREVTEKRYLAKIQPKPRSILLEAVKHPEITNKRLSEITKTQRSNVSKYVQLLETNGCLYLRRKDGKDKYWSVEPKLKWLLLEAGDKKQKKLTHYSDD